MRPIVKGDIGLSMSDLADIGIDGWCMGPRRNWRAVAWRSERIVLHRVDNVLKIAITQNGFQDWRVFWVNGNHKKGMATNQADFFSNFYRPLNACITLSFVGVFCWLHWLVEDLFVWSWKMCPVLLWAILLVVCHWGSSTGIRSWWPSCIFHKYWWFITVIRYSNFHFLL